MKRFLPLLLILAFLKAGAQSYQYLGSYNNQGVPNYLDGFDTISQGFLNRVSASLPESYPVPTYNPHYISSGIDTDVKLQDSADVWVTFVGEGAGYRNILGFYTYHIDTPLTSPPAKSDVTIVFPNVSAQGSGGGLKVGDRVKIGTFPKNTGIGWVLIADGWKGRKVTDGKWILYNNPDFNPENDTNLRHHNVLLNDTAEQVILLGFEDIRRDNNGCDNDFNDALFYVKSNPINAIITTNFNLTAPAGGGVSGGNGSGLESTPGLAQQIGRRNISRLRTDYQYEKAVYNPDAISYKTSASVPFKSWIPDSLLTSDATFESTPEDLIELTNANDIFALDYSIQGANAASVLVSHTNNKVYDHTKTICDRLKGAKLLNVETFKMDGYQFVLCFIERADGKKEYSTSFSMHLEDEMIIESFYNLSDYSESADIYNIQFWAQNPTYVKYLVRQYIREVKENYNLSQPRLPNAPEFFVSTVEYVDQELQMTVKNTTNRTESIALMGTYSTAEFTPRLDWNDNFQLSGSGCQVLTVDIGSVFDADIRVYDATGNLMDVMYAADGNWGLDYSFGNTTIHSFDVHPFQSAWSEDRVPIERDVAVHFSTNDYLNVYRYLNPGGMAESMNGFQGIGFHLESDVAVEVKLVLPGRTWAQQPSAVAFPGENILPFSKLEIDPAVDELIGVVFSFKSSNGEVRELSAEVQGLSLLKQWNKSLVLDEIDACPNPTGSLLNMRSEFPVKQARIIDLSGKTRLESGCTETHLCTFDMSALRSGVYILMVETQKGIFQKKIVKL